MQFLKVRGGGGGGRERREKLLWILKIHYFYAITITIFFFYLMFESCIFTKQKLKFLLSKCLNYRRF